MDETQIKQIIERQPLHGTALLDPRCKILLLVCIGSVSYTHLTLPTNSRV